MALCLPACKHSSEDDEPTTYTVTVASTIENGSVTASSTSATAGTEITLTATPNSGYQFSAFSVIDASGNAITVTDSKFTMPASNVTVSATFTNTLNQPVAVTGISLDKATAQTVTVGNSISFTATVSPDNATDKTVKWSVSGTGVTLYSDSACSTAITTDTAISTLTVYAKGTATGNATVTVTSNADSTKTASCAVHVKESATGHALSASEVGEVVGIDGLAYAVTDKDNLPTGVNAAGMVAYKNGTNGLVIALTDEAGQMNYSTANGASGAAAHMPTVTGYSWKQTGVDEFKQMFEANGGSQTDCSGLNTAIGKAGGTGLNNGAYWTSTWISGELSPYIMEAYSPVRFRTSPDHFENRVRACLEF